MFFDGVAALVALFLLPLTIRSRPNIGAEIAILSLAALAAITESGVMGPSALHIQSVVMVMGRVGVKVSGPVEEASGSS
jgi:hypothetical protein